MVITLNKIIVVSLVVIVGLAWFFSRDVYDNQSLVSDISPRSTDDGTVKIIAMGDSLTAGYGLPISESYPAQLESALIEQGLRVRVINSGVSGETTKGNLERASFIRNQAPDIVLLGIGGNDALRLLPLTETKDNLRQTVEVLRSGVNPPVVILLQMQAPLNVGLSYKQSFDAMYKEVASEFGLILLPFITTEVFLKAQNKLPDGIHLNRLGYSEVVSLYLLDTVAQVVKQVGG